MKRIIYWYLPLSVTPRQIRKGRIPKRFLPKKVRENDVIFFMVNLPTPRYIVVVKFPKDIDGQIATCKDVYYKMNHTSWVVVADVVPTLASVAVEIGKLDAATSLANTHAVGTAEARLAQLTVVKKLIYEIALGYVQQLVDSTPGHETEIAEQCGMSTKLTGGRQAVVDSVRATGIDKQVELSGRTKKNSTIIHEWQVTKDPSGDPIGWYQFPITCTKKATRLVDNLPIDVDLYFRHRFILNDVPQEWGQLMKIKLTH